MRHSRAAPIAGMDEHVDNSCKQRAEYLRCSLVIVCSERGQWQASFIREKLTCLAEVNVAERILREFLNSRKSEHVQTVCTRLFSPHPRMSLGMRLYSIHTISPSIAPPAFLQCSTFFCRTSMCIFSWLSKCKQPHS